MQTFLPYSDFARSARCLDRQRLGKQRVEVLTILHVLAGIVRGWRNHPAVRMWRGFETALAEYGYAICTEWMRRGYRDNCRRRIDAWRHGVFHRPPWLGDERVHASHRSNLLRKDAVWYGRFGWSESADLPYVWPA